MRKRIAIAVTAAALAASPLAVAPAQASETHLCTIWAPPYDRVFCTVVNAVCTTPWPPLFICR